MRSFHALQLLVISMIALPCLSMAGDNPWGFNQALSQYDQTHTRQYQSADWTSGYQSDLWNRRGYFQPYSGNSYEPQHQTSYIMIHEQDPGALLLNAMMERYYSRPKELTQWEQWEQMRRRSSHNYDHD